MGTNQSKRRNKCIRTEFILVREIDFVAKEHEPLLNLQWSEDDSVGRLAVFAVVVEGFHQEFRRTGAGKVQSNNLNEHEIHGWNFKLKPIKTHQKRLFDYE